MIGRRGVVLGLMAAGLARPALARVVDIAATVSARPELSTLARAVAASGLAQQLADAGPFTLFAPNDAAFAALPAGTLDELLRPANRAKLDQLLAHHAARRSIAAADLDQLIRPLQMLDGGYVEINGMAGVRIGPARVVTADVPATNGRIHVIDRVLTA